MTALDPDRVLARTAALAKPRLAGTEGERRARAEVAEGLREAGLEPVEEAFDFLPVSDALTRTRLLATHLGLLAVAAAPLVHWGLAAGGLAWWALATFLCAAYAQWCHDRAFRPASAEAPAGGWRRAANVFATAGGDGPRLVFLAHLDSKSQNLSLGGLLGRLALMPYFTAATIALAVCALFMPEAPQWAALIPAGLLLLSALPLYVLHTRDRSPGADDNASGVAALLELARVWKDLPAAKRFRATFLATSAEEFGMIGARFWLARHAEGLTAAVNLDSIGTPGPVRFVPERTPLAQPLREAAREAGIHLAAFPPGVAIATDHSAFAERGIPVVTLMTHSWNAKRFHTPQDTPDALSRESIASICHLLPILVRKLSS
jgi:hypothetical protein